MVSFELIMPKMGESVTEASITQWVKEVGDTIEVEDPVLEIATDKVDSEIPSPVKGILVKKLFKKGETIKVGQAVAIIETKDKANSHKNTTDIEVETTEKIENEISRIKNSISTDNIQSSQNNAKTDKFYSPLVRSIAKAEGVLTSELDQIKGSGSNDRVTKNDILGYIQNRKQEENIKMEKTPTSPQILGVSGSDEIVQMDRMRKIISNHMTTSLKTSAHVTSFVEADVTNIVNWRNSIKDTFLKRERQKITFTPMFIEAVAKAIRDFPLINSSVDGNKIIKKSNINVGMAAALPNGNLVVPVIKNADNLNLIGLAKIVNDLAYRAKNNKLKPDEIQEGTFTLTNIGSFGNTMGTPIINQPQVAILAIGAIIKKPAVIETPQGDTVGVRHKMFLSHSYDHRIIDGALGGMFVKRVAEYLEAFDINTPI